MPVFKDINIVIAQLDELQQAGFIFRGHESFKYILMPNAFRTPTLLKMKREFEIQDSVIDEWFKNKFIMQSVNDWYLQNKRKLMPLEQQTISRLLHYCLYLMRYNHALNIFAHKNPHRVSRKDRETILERNLEYWKSERTFQQLFSSYFPRIIKLTNLDGTTLQDANPFEDLASVDETLVQHYDPTTAALDWTLNYNIAIHFAVGEKEIAEKFLAIYALKIHNPNSSPIHVMNKSIYVENIRAERQEGTFTYFTKPCSFYLENGYLPSINNFDQRYKNNLDVPTFELQEFIIERSENNIGHLKKLLIQREITKKYLFPDEECIENAV